MSEDPDAVSLNNVDILRLMVEARSETREVAQWAHLLQEAIDAGEMSFPLESLEALTPLYARVSAARLEVPPVEVIPVGFAPFADMADFIRKATVVKQACIVVHPFKSGDNPLPVHRGSGDTPHT